MTELAHGACIYGGADIWAEKWAKDRAVPYGAIRRRWATTVTSRGRNAINRCLPPSPLILAVAFPGGRGTADMVRRAQAAGIAVKKAATGPQTSDG